MARETPDFSGTSSKYPIRQKRPVINVIVTGDLTGVVSILFHYLRKIVVYRVELQCVGLAPCDSKVKGFSCTACPEDHFVPLTAHPVQVIDQAHIRFSGIRPIAVTEGSVKVDRYDLMIQSTLPSVISSVIPFVCDIIIERVFDLSIGYVHLLRLEYCGFLSHLSLFVSFFKTRDYISPIVLDKTKYKEQTISQTLARGPRG